MLFAFNAFVGIPENTITGLQLSSLEVWCSLSIVSCNISIYRLNLNWVQGPTAMDHYILIISNLNAIWITEFFMELTGNEKQKYII